MAAVGSFARSDAGAAYAAICERWGVDPGAAFEDDVLAHNLRAALMIAQAGPQKLDDDDDWVAAGAANTAAWLMPGQHQDANEEFYPDGQIGEPAIHGSSS